MPRSGREIPVFVFNGLLESGKTTMIRRFLDNKTICGGRRILLLLCEQGIEELENSFLEERGVIIRSIDEENGFSPLHLEALNKETSPDLVVAEWNGMWRGTLPAEMRWPDGWSLVEVLTTVDFSTFDAYSKNLRSIMLDQFRIADIVVYNRFREEGNKFNCRALVKAVNPSAQVVFEYEDGTIDSEFDSSPFDLSGDTVDIPDADFGIWYFDVMDHLDKYLGKTVCLRAICVKITGIRMDGFLVGRLAMTCCANDIQLLSVYAKNNLPFKNKAWYTVRAKVVSVDSSVYGEAPGMSLPALEVLDLKAAEKPAQEVVTF
ncbi:MAG: hypothetical protein J5938_02920 [Clostridia bacterium]|nr:hypothetical protein [Clostridia bacterium]